ncbi:hypothetical protein [Flavobacterium flavigenum]|uniref:hypothetical protein n=1 Tax=Flavobacterium flavigenum TaxID=3003258 RepID=UPI0022AC0B42|nr:hypothetical protein [Flavobacterium flavigenum]
MVNPDFPRKKKNRYIKTGKTYEDLAEIYTKEGNFHLTFLLDARKVSKPGTLKLHLMSGLPK